MSHPSQLPVEVVLDVVVARLLGNVDHDARGRAALLGEAEAAVADTSTGRTHPTLAQQGIPYLLPIAIAQTWTTELQAQVKLIISEL